MSSTKAMFSLFVAHPIEGTKSYQKSSKYSVHSAETHKIFLWTEKTLNSPKPHSISFQKDSISHQLLRFDK